MSKQLACRIQRKDCEVVMCATDVHQRRTCKLNSCTIMISVSETYNECERCKLSSRIEGALAHSKHIAENGINMQHGGPDLQSGRSRESDREKECCRSDFLTTAEEKQKTTRTVYGWREPGISFRSRRSSIRDGRPSVGKEESSTHHDGSPSVCCQRRPQRESRRRCC